MLTKAKASLILGCGTPSVSGSIANSATTAGSGVTFINPSPINGTFSDVNSTGLNSLTATVGYNNAAGDVYVTLAVIPEPGTYTAILGEAGESVAHGPRRRG